MKNGNEVVRTLRSSCNKVGKLYPVIEDFQGNIIDGRHRLEADKKWPRLCLEHVKTEKALIVARLVSNVCRRKIPKKEKREMLDKLSDILVKEGMQSGEISKKIVEETGMSYTWVMKYLSKKYKDSSQSKRALSATRHVATMAKLNVRPLGKSWRANLIKIEEYKNSEFVFVAIKKSLYDRVKRASAVLNAVPEILIQDAIINSLRRVEKDS